MLSHRIRRSTSQASNTARRRRGREGSFPPSPRTDPGVRFSRTGLFRQSRLRNTPLMQRLCCSPQEVCLDYPAHHVRSRFPLWATTACQPLPLVDYQSPHANGPTVSEYYGLIRLPGSLRLAYLSFRLRLPGPCFLQEPPGSPKFLALLFTHPTLFVDPGRPSEHSPVSRRSLCWFLAR